MNSPYIGKFRVTQEYKGSAHDGFDLVGIDSKEIHSTATGKVIYAGWENAGNHAQGFGQYVCIRGTDGRYYYYGHLSQIRTSTGQAVRTGDVIGIEGNTGRSTGSHCHYCIRPAFCKGNSFNVSQLSGIPNALGVYGVTESLHTWCGKFSQDIRNLQNILIAKGMNISADGIAGEQTLSACKRYTIQSGDRGELTKWVQNRLNSPGFSCGTADGIAGTKTMAAISRFQEKNVLGIGYLGGEDWYYLING